MREIFLFNGGDLMHSRAFVNMDPKIIKPLHAFILNFGLGTI